MKIEKIYIGTWFQRTSLHLKEFFHFLQTGKSELDLDQAKLTTFFRRLSPKKVRWEEKEIFDNVWAQFNNLEMLFYEDGLIFLKKDYQDLKKDFQTLKSFYEKKFGPAVSYLYSLGAPLPKRLAETELILPYIVVASGAEKGEIKDLFSQIKDSLRSSVDAPEISIYSGNKLFVLNVKTEEKDIQIEEIIKYSIFFREFTAQLNGYLRAHRAIWEEVHQIRSQPVLFFRDFPKVRNSLMEIKQTLSFVEARLAQMENFMTIRQERAKEKGLEEILRSLSIYQFGTLANAHRYMTSLWQMTKDYADSTFDLLNMFYQENVQREVDALKLVTIISLMATFFRLSSMTNYQLLHPQFLGSIVLIFVFAAIFYFGMRHWFRSRKFELHKKVKEVKKIK